VTNQNELNRINEELLERINKTGKIFISHTTLNDVYTLRMVISQTNVTQEHVDEAWDLIKIEAKFLIPTI